MKKETASKNPPAKVSTSQMHTPVGNLKLIVSSEGLHAVLWDKEAKKIPYPTRPSRAPSETIMKQTRQQLIEYFTGKRESFDIPMVPEGTPFQLKVWKQLSRIPYGKTVSYAEIAKKIGEPSKARAVGAAIGKNPLSIVVPCHRVIGKNGSLTGFAGGLEAKKRLLELETKS